MTPEPLLSCRGLEAGYGTSQVLFGLDFAIHAGEVITLLGRNGMGKSTAIKALIGGLRARRGEIHFSGHAIHNARPDAIARLGMAIVPEGRQCFPNLTVREHLVAFAANRGGLGEPWTPERLYALFPGLKARAGHLGNQLSGGAGDSRGDLALSRPAEGRRPDHAGGGQICREANRARRPSSHPRTRPHRLERQLGRTGRRPGVVESLPGRVSAFDHARTRGRSAWNMPDTRRGKSGKPGHRRPLSRHRAPASGR